MPVWAGSGSEHAVVVASRLGGNDVPDDAVSAEQQQLPKGVVGRREQLWAGGHLFRG